MGGAISCGPKAEPYPAALPSSMSLPDGVSILQPNEKNAVVKAVSVCARSFAGMDAVPGPSEFDWQLFDKKNQKITDVQERVHILSAAFSFTVHQAFLMKDRGLVLVVRGENEEIIGVLILYLYPKKWEPDSSWFQMKVAMAAGLSKWDAAQKEFVSSKRALAFEKALVDMKKQHCVGDSCCIAYVQVVAVDPEHQKKGVGKKLLSAACAVGDELRLPLFLETDAGRVDAFFQKFGFKDLGSSTIETKDGERFEGSLLAMRRPIGE